MKDETSKGQRVTNRAARKVSAHWPAFAKRLAKALDRLQEDQYLIITLKGSSRAVQFAGQGAWGIRAEVIANQYLPRSQRLDDRSINRLLDAGWQSPTGTAANSTPDADPDGSPNYFVQWPARQPLAKLARLTARTLVEVLGVPHPGWLEYEAFGEHRDELEFPELGLKHVPRPAPAAATNEIRQRLLATIRRVTGINELAFDTDGDIVFARGSMAVVIGVAKRQPEIYFQLLLVTDIGHSTALVERINGMNARVASMHLVYQQDVVVAFASVPSKPFVEEHVAHVLEEVCALCEGLGEVIQAEFGGLLPAASDKPRVTLH